jgi:hypothetical protein
MSKLLLILLDGVPYANGRRRFGNLEGWVARSEVPVCKMRAVLPSAVIPRKHCKCAAF